MFNRKCKITFIAHGATIHSEENIISETETYPPLDDEGYTEIEKICDFLKKRGVKTDKIYTSPALRTVQSAQLISKTFKKDFEILEDLHNRDYGDWKGLSYSQISDKEKLLAFTHFKNPTITTPKNGEELATFNKRVDEIIKKVVNENYQGRIIIVTYRTVIQAAVCNALNLSPENQYKIYIKTGSATQISYYDDWASLMYSGYVPL